jgi:hypothetical protein
VHLEEKLAEEAAAALAAAADGAAGDPSIATDSREAAVSEGRE